MKTIDYDVFNKKQIYEADIKPIIAEIKNTCKNFKIPCFITCCVASDENGCEFESTCYSIGKGVTCNLKTVYEDNIAELVQKLIIECEKNSLPMYISCCVENSEYGAEYIRECRGTGSNGNILIDDQIATHLCVANGFKVAPVSNIPSLEADLLDIIDDLNNS